jgi:hypothetical protein
VLPAFEKDLKTHMAETFGADGSYGVFVRSDTNAEDLPEFTGAGLNLTVPNQVGYRQIAQSIKDVWASRLRNGHGLEESNPAVEREGVPLRTATALRASAKSV